VYVAVSYEDGRSFQDMTKVKMEKIDGTEDPPEYIESFAGQQQQ